MSLVKQLLPKLKPMVNLENKHGNYKALEKDWKSEANRALLGNKSPKNKKFKIIQAPSNE